MDLDKIRAKLQALSGVKQQVQSDVKWLKLEEGQYKIRALPWPSHLTTDGNPIVEKWFYYFCKPSLVAPYSVGEPDPIHELMKNLYREKTEASKKLANQLRAKARAFLPVVIRGQEDQGVHLWSIAPSLYEKLLGYFLDEEVGDFLDVDTGYDISVVVKKVKDDQGREFPKIDLDLARKPSKLSSDSHLVEEWKQQIPDINKIYKVKSEQEVKEVLENWLNSANTKPSNSLGTEKTVVDVEKAVVQPQVKEVAVVKQAKVSKEPKVSVNKSLDDAFKELEDDDSDDEKLF